MGDAILLAERAEAKQQDQQERWREGRAGYERLAVLGVCLAAGREGLCSVPVRWFDVRLGGRLVASRLTNPSGRAAATVGGGSKIRRRSSAHAELTVRGSSRTGKPIFGQCRPFEASAVTSPMRWREERPQSWRETPPETDRRPSGRSPTAIPITPPASRTAPEKRTATRSIVERLRSDRQGREQHELRG
jgi:hypothetical protein